LSIILSAGSSFWNERPLFDEHIQAWANGPVCPRLYDQHCGIFRVNADTITGDPDRLSKDARETVDAVLSFYGDKTAQWLSDLTHSEGFCRKFCWSLSAGIGRT
jgi:uncharacterized phage-associated protein